MNIFQPNWVVVDECRIQRYVLQAYDLLANGQLPNLEN